MKNFAIFLILILALGGSAYAQTAPVDTSVTSAAVGTYPAGTSYNGVPLSGLEIAAGSVIFADGSGGDGTLGIRLLGVSTGLTPPQIINIDAQVTAGSRTAATAATVSGTCTIDMGNGLPPVTGIPFTATIAADVNNLGAVTLVLGSTTLPAATIGEGSLTVTDMQ
jgi:hypothetical protein